MDHKKLRHIADELRINILKGSHVSKIPHLGSCLSCVDILTTIYWEAISSCSNDPNNPDRDRVILSKGHAAPALFQVLALKGLINEDKINDMGKNGSYLHEHPPKPGVIPGIEAATGSLGHGLPIALGIAKSAKINKKNFNVFVIVGDGECNEGSIWEAALLAPVLKLNNLIVFVDFNKWQATGKSNEITNLDPLKEKWLSFGWHVQEINGHNIKDISTAINLAKLEHLKPSMIVANTIKGKGVSFMENNNNWHYRTPNKNELNIAIEEIKKHK